MDTSYLHAIRSFEGFTPRAQWDYAQHTNGFGTKALYAGEVIDRAEAERRFQSEISSAEKLVDQFAPGLDAGTRAALTSLTFNAGTRWMSSGLGAAVKAGDGAAMRERFLSYTKAGVAELPGLVSRRTQEAAWIAASTPAHVALASASPHAAPAGAPVRAATAAIAVSVTAADAVRSAPVSTLRAPDADLSRLALAHAFERIARSAASTSGETANDDGAHAAAGLGPWLSTILYKT